MTAAEAMARRRVVGQPAAPGLAVGRVVEWPPAPRSPSSRPAAGRGPVPLQAALEAAVAQLQDLRDAAGDDDARAILEFQIEFLGDPSLLEPVQAQLDAGADAAAAWCEAIDLQIADFEASGDDYFRHRVGDLRDMRARVLAALCGEAVGSLDLPDDAIVLADDLAPSAFLATHWQPRQAVLLRGGSPTAHVALLTRSRAVPMVVGLGDAAPPLGSTVIVDGAAGTVELAPDAAALDAFRRRQAELERAHQRAALGAFAAARTAGGERVQVMLNIVSPDELSGIEPAICEGIGLVRTELMFADGPPSEEVQLGAYCSLLRWAGDRPVVVRTLDAGGDKPIAGVTIDGEANPFLGLRGLRLSLRRPDAFKVQLRALLRAAEGGDLRVMLPMVTCRAEVDAARQLLAACADELRGEGVAYRVPPLGVMVEVPAAALALDSLGPIGFASIGSNDLLQYLMAAARDNPSVHALADAGHPAFARLLSLIVEQAVRARIPLSLCGDLAAQPARVPLLLQAGLRSLSMPAASVGSVKQAIAAWTPSA